VTGPARTAAGNRYTVLSVVPDGPGYVLGSRYSRDFVAVPGIGGDVVRWLQAGYSVDECADRAARRMGEPVDVAGFVAGLAAAGLLPPEGAEDGQADDRPAEDGQPAAEVPPAARRIGRILFGRTGLTVQVVLALGAVVAMVAVPRLRPHYTDAIVTGVPLVSLLLVAAIGTLSGLVHEYAHVLAAAARGVPGRVSISRRMVTIVYQTDLTRLWAVPRRDRVVPLLAGLLSDAATVGVLVAIEASALIGDGLAGHLLRALVFIKIAGIAFQLEIFMRTDLYALFVVLTGCRNLWATKGALARRAIRRPSADDLAQIGAAGAREVFWAKVYLLLYVPGVAWTTWYFAVFGLPALGRIVAMSVHAVSAYGLASMPGAAGALALALTTASTGFVLLGLARTGYRLVRRLVRDKPVAIEPAATLS
jgi:putative peptide zinc metalloprotease protein